jgi:16S rRNA (cytidine1402-2'-O)-methyltransferase
MARDEGLTVTSLPGPCALITALTLSGLPTRRFVFEGFLPSEKKERRGVLDTLKTEERTIILYEAPHHLKKTLQDLLEALGDRRVVFCRELTKKFEEALERKISEQLTYLEENEARGEYVLVIEGRNPEERIKEAQEEFASLTVEEHMEKYLAEGMDKKEAMKKVAADRGVSKREIYAILSADSQKV